MKLPEHFNRNMGRYYLILICTLVCILSTKGITDEGTVSLNGDMPKYLMNGAFLYDLVRDMPSSDFMGCAYRYFARYPALSLGHHPLLLGIAEVPFYYLFGISVFSARLTIVFFTLLAAISWFLLTRSIYSDNIALLSSLLFITSPVIVSLSWEVMSEIPTLSLVIAATYLFYKYCEEEKRGYIYAFAIVFALSLYSKHTALLMAPVYFSYFLMRKGFKKLKSIEIWLSIFIIAVLAGPLVPLTLKYSHHNVDYIQYSADYMTQSVNNMMLELYYSFYCIWKAYPSYVTWILALISSFLYMFRRDNRAYLFIIWMVGLFLLFFFIGAPSPRHTIYYIPAISLLAVVSVNVFRSHTLKVFIYTLLILTVGYQLAVAIQKEPWYTSGYEEAAKYIVDNNKGETVLYRGVYDTGYFIFFVRKQASAHDFIVLRADKILATSNMMSIVDDRIKKREEIYEHMKNYGIRYVVIEGTKSKSQSLEWLREEVKTDRFKLLKEITIESNDARVHNVLLGVYEYIEYTPPKEGEVLQMNVPLIGDSIAVPLEAILP